MKQEDRPHLPASSRFSTCQSDIQEQGRVSAACAGRARPHPCAAVAELRSPCALSDRGPNKPQEATKMPLREYKAKAHVFLDVGMEAVLNPIDDAEVRAGAGCKVVVTIGPACHDVATLSRLLLAGVTCARINLSWGTKAYYEHCLTNLAKAMKQTRRLCSVFVDTVGREVTIRRPVEYDANGWPTQTGAKTLAIQEGQTVTITTDTTAEASPTLLPVSSEGFPIIVDVGQMIQIGRYLATGAEGGSLYLQVVETTPTTVVCKATNSATLDGLLTVMICHQNDEDFRGDFELPLLTPEDEETIKYLGSKYEIDFLNLSYCNREEDLYAARAFLDSAGMRQTKIIAKIERKSAVHNFEGIAAVADGLIISRGNLGLDFEAEIMALLQKRIISRCNQLGKPVLLTRFVDTMVSTPRPTRAEATDVANAVLDGADGMLLGAETLRGLHPVLTVETVLKLCAAAERMFDYRTHHEMLMGEAYEEEVSLAHASSSMADFGLFHQQLRGAAASSSTPEHTVHTLHRHRVPSSQTLSSAGGANGSGALGLAAENSVGSMGAGAGAASPGPAPHTYVSEFGSLPPRDASSNLHLNRILLTHAPYMTKLESLASSATRTAEKINAGLIIVMVQSGRTVSLVAKYRPPMPIMAVVVPKLTSTWLGWQLEGKFLARQTCVLRGVVPMLAAPMSEGSDDLLNEAVYAACSQRLVKPNDFVVCLKSVRGNMMVKVVQVNRSGTGIRAMCGQNSHEIGGEAPDIISDRSPFGSWVCPPSPSAAAAALSPRAFGRTLSGKPSPVLAPAAASPGRQGFMLGVPNAGLLMATLSENYERTAACASDAAGDGI
ncbi:hypothetical protein ABPG75_013886 [Micractinium tetrahymenae]